MSGFGYIAMRFEEIFIYAETRKINKVGLQPLTALKCTNYKSLLLSGV